MFNTVLIVITNFFYLFSTVFTHFIYKDTPLATAFQLGFYAIVLFQIGFVFFQTIFVRRAEYYYYILYMICIIPYFLSHTEAALNISVFFTYHPELKVYFDKPLVILNFLTYINFSKNFLDIPVKYPAFNKLLTKVITALTAIGLGGFAIAIFFADSAFTENLFMFFYALAFASSAWAIYNFYKLQGTQLFNFVLWGAILIICGAISSTVVFRMVELGTLSHDVIATVPAQVCVLAELLVFTTGLGYKTSLIERQKIETEQALVKELKEREQLQLSVYQMRSKIASDLHDDVGATLSSIGMFSQIAKTKPALATEVLGRIATASNDMVDRMGDIVWSINPSNDSFEKLIARVRDFSLNYFSAKGIAFKCDITANLSQVPVTMEQGRDLYLLVKEAMNNAAKYAECSEVVLKIEQPHSGGLRLAVSDNGKGFNPADCKAFNGNGLKNMQMRATALNGRLAIDSAPGCGTTVQLEFDFSNYHIR